MRSGLVTPPAAPRAAWAPTMIGWSRPGGKRPSRAAQPRHLGYREAQHQRAEHYNEGMN